jgi:hypothetical protein
MHVSLISGSPSALSICHFCTSLRPSHARTQNKVILAPLSHAVARLQQAHAIAPRSTSAHQITATSCVARDDTIASLPGLPMELILRKLQCNKKPPEQQKILSAVRGTCSDLHGKTLHYVGSKHFTCIKISLIEKDVLHLRATS